MGSATSVQECLALFDDTLSQLKWQSIRPVAPQDLSVNETAMLELLLGGSGDVLESSSLISPSQLELPSDNTQSEPAEASEGLPDAEQRTTKPPLSESQSDTKADTVTSLAERLPNAPTRVLQQEQPHQTSSPILAA